MLPLRGWGISCLGKRRCILCWDSKNPSAMNLLNYCFLCDESIKCTAAFGFGAIHFSSRNVFHLPGSAFIFHKENIPWTVMAQHGQWKEWHMTGRCLRLVQGRDRRCAWNWEDGYKQNQTGKFSFPFVNSKIFGLAELGNPNHTFLSCAFRFLLTNTCVIVWNIVSFNFKSYMLMFLIHRVLQSAVSSQSDLFCCLIDFKYVVHMSVFENFIKASWLLLYVNVYSCS